MGDERFILPAQPSTSSIRITVTREHNFGYQACQTLSLIMRITEIIFVAALASTAAAQTIAQEIALLPSCSASCISDAISLATTCGDTDYACQCSTTNSAAIFDSAGACLLNACSSADLLSKYLELLVTVSK